MKTAKRGRPAQFTPKIRRTIAKHLRAKGLSDGVLSALVYDNITVSIPTAKKIAVEYGITFTRGRPKTN